MLNQFHDILPGSSIAVVNDEAVAAYGFIRARLEDIIERAISALSRHGATPLVFNAAPHERDGVAALGAAPVLPAAGSARAIDGNILENDRLRVTLDEDGHIASLIDLVRGREVLPPGMCGNVLQLHPDVPNKWPAWDIDAFYRNRRTDLGAPGRVTVLSEGPHEAAIEVEYSFGSSRAVQVLRLAAGSGVLEMETEVDWDEKDRLLKVAFPVDVHATYSTSEVQFGHLQRPAHSNTSWDAARFEFVAHRFIHVGEGDYGAALVNAGTYGHDVLPLERRGGGRAVVARLSLVRGPTFPDPRSDKGVHRFRYGIVPGATISDAVREGYRFNLPPRAASGQAGVVPLVSLSNPAVVVEAVKAADDRSGDVVVRCYESLGGRSATTVSAPFPIAGAWTTDLLERPTEQLEIQGANEIGLCLRPFQVVTLRLSRK